MIDATFTTKAFFINTTTQSLSKFTDTMLSNTCIAFPTSFSSTNTLKRKKKKERCLLGSIELNHLID